MVTSTLVLSVPVEEIQDKDQIAFIVRREALIGEPQTNMAFAVIESVWKKQEAIYKSVPDWDSKDKEFKETWAKFTHTDNSIKQEVSTAH